MIDRSAYLFLQAVAPGSTVGDTNMQVLLSDEHRGAVFVNGILIKRFADDPTNGCLAFGINYTGSKKNYSLLKLGRDRNTIDVARLLTMLPDLLTRVQADAVPVIVERVYDELQTNPMGASRAFRDYEITPLHSHTKFLIDVANHFKRVNHQGDGIELYPVRSDGGGSAAAFAAEKAQALALGANPISV